MENIQQNQIVRAIAGRDKPGYFIVVKTEDGFCFVADGKRRRIENPKKKNPIHLQPTKTVITEQLASNKQAREILKKFIASGNQ